MWYQVGHTYEKHIEWGSQLEVQPVSYSPNTCDELLPNSVASAEWFFVGLFVCSLLVLYIYLLRTLVVHHSVFSDLSLFYCKALFRDNNLKNNKNQTRK